MKLIGIFLWVVIFVSRHFIVQGVHEMILERIDILYADHKYGDANCTVRRISRTDYALTVYFSVFQDGLAEFTDINIQGYTLHNNEYRLDALSIKRNVCQFFNMEWNFIKAELIKTGNIPVKCPVMKGFYNLKDFILYTKNFPQLPIMHGALLYVNLTYKHQLIGSLKIYVRVNQDAKIINKVLSAQ